MSAKLEISATYAATDGSMPEDVNVAIQPGDVPLSELVVAAVTIVELLVSAPAQRHARLGELS